MIRDAYLQAAAIAASLLHEPVLAGQWGQSSALSEFSVGGLAAHLSYNIVTVPDRLAEPPGSAAISVLDHYTRSAWLTSGPGSEANAGIRGRNNALAVEAGADRIAEAVDAAVAVLRRTLPAEPDDRVVDLGDWGLTVDDFLLTRLLEIVVHADDLAVSVDLPPPQMPSMSTDAVIAVLARVATWRHGPIAVIRTLARRERAPATIAAL